LNGGDATENANKIQSFLKGALITYFKLPEKLHTFDGAKAGLEATVSPTNGMT